MNQLLDNATNYMSTRGYRIISQSDEKVQLVKPEKKSCLLILILFLCGIIPAIFYVLITKDRSLMITAYADKFVAIDERGKSKVVPIGQIQSGNYKALMPKRFPWMLIALILGLLVWVLIISALSSGDPSTALLFLAAC